MTAEELYTAQTGLSPYGLSTADNGENPVSHEEPGSGGFMDVPDSGGEDEYTDEYIAWLISSVETLTQQVADDAAGMTLLADLEYQIIHYVHENRMKYTTELVDIINKVAVLLHLPEVTN